MMITLMTAGRTMACCDYQSQFPIIQILNAMIMQNRATPADSVFTMPRQAWACLETDGRPRNLRLQDAQGRRVYRGISVAIQKDDAPVKPTRRPLNSPCAPA